MSKFTLYNSDASEIEVVSDIEIKSVLKFYAFQQQLQQQPLNSSSSSFNEILVLSENFNLFTGFIEKNYVRLKLWQKNVIDIELFNDILYKVTEDGCVYKCHMNELDKGDGSGGVWSEIIVRNLKSCLHGYKSFSDKIKIISVNCNYDGVLFTSVHHELYGMGCFSENLKMDTPTKFDCFDGLRVLGVATGDNFAVILTQKRADNNGEYSGSENGPNVSEVFYNSECPKCPSQNNKVCKNISKSTTETSMASSPSDTCDISDDTDVKEATEQSTSNPQMLMQKQNRDSTINFLFETLSISGEDFLEASKQTRLIKDNVTNITTMVYEGVKTLSRHMSGSDSNEKLDTLGAQKDGDERVVKNGRDAESMSDMSSTNGSACFYDVDDDDDETAEPNDNYLRDYGVEKNINLLCRVGNNLIATGVWSFGSVNREGQLGTGDHVKRNIIIPVLKLQGQGVTKISCGKNHSIARTLDGRLFLWGCNLAKQISVEPYDEYSTPKLFKNKEKVFDAVCSDLGTIIMLNDLNIHEEKKSVFSNVLTSSFEITKNVKNDENCVGDYRSIERLPTFLTSKNLVIVNHRLLAPIYEFVTSEQKFLYEILVTYNVQIKSFLKKTSSLPYGTLYDSLCHLYQNIINLTAVNVQTIKDYFHRHINCSQITLISSLTELDTLYRNYLRKFCNVLCINGYEHIQYLFKNEKSHIASTINVRKIFESPFRRIWAYIEIIDELIKYEHDFAPLLIERKNYLDKFRKDKDREIKEADRTLTFWKTIDKKMLMELQEPERRLILDSKEVFLKFVPSPTFNTPRIILFSDYLCHYTGQLVKHQLTTLWVESIPDHEPKVNNMFRVITPETNLVIAARSHADKMNWVDQISQCIKSSLNKTKCPRVPAHRNTSYVFGGDHPVYGRVKYFGMWLNGQMHGIGRLEFPDGRVYSGLMTNNEIHGFGQMFIPNQGTYEGNFEGGKFHGYGILEMNTKERYKGSFRQGEFSGHGKLENDQFQYIGEFARNMKNGYGVLDIRSSTGYKYLGMFENNKKHGLGILYTKEQEEKDEGNLFSGVFVEGNLTGDGFAALADGSYYRGELTLHGPSGKGALYLCNDSKSSASNLDNLKSSTIMGRKIVGSFSGTWKNIKITNGNLAMDVVESEPLTSIIHNINPFKKWCSLFRDWEMEVFHENHRTHPTTAIWEKISVFVANSKRKEKLKSDNFIIKSSMAKLMAAANQNIKFKSHKSLNPNSETVSLVSSLSNRSLTQYSKSSTLDIYDCNLMKQKSISGELLMVNNDGELDNRRHDGGGDCKDEFQNGQLVNSNDNLSFADTNSSHEKRKQNRERILETTPNFGMQILTKEDVERIKEYLYEAYNDIHHPLGVLILKISKSFHFSYGHWNNRKPSILTGQALAELESISKRVYKIIRKLFPALPEDSVIIEDEKISHRTFYSALLSNTIYSSLFVLYASKCSPFDEICQRRMRHTDKKSDEELLRLIKIEIKFLPLVRHPYFLEAIKNFHEVETKCCPYEMLAQIKKTFDFVKKATHKVFGDTVLLNADLIIPLTIYLILRANIPHVGAELLMLEDLLESENVLNFGEEGNCFVTIKASYEYVINNLFED